MQLLLLDKLLDTEVSGATTAATTASQPQHRRAAVILAPDAATGHQAATERVTPSAAASGRHRRIRSYGQPEENKTLCAFSSSHSSDHDCRKTSNVQIPKNGLCLRLTEHI